MHELPVRLSPFRTDQPNIRHMASIGIDWAGLNYNIQSFSASSFRMRLRDWGAMPK
jgi:hypothetical protein